MTFHSLWLVILSLWPFVVQMAHTYQVRLSRHIGWAFVIDFLSSLIILNYLFIRNSIITLPLAFQVYGAAMLLLLLSSICFQLFFFAVLFATISYHNSGAGEENSSDEGADSVDLEKTVLRSFSNLFTTTGTNSNSQSSSDSEREYPNCAICLIEYEKNDMVREMPCKHHFHQECIDKWLEKHRRCPLCRQRPSEVVTQPPQSQSQPPQPPKLRSEPHLENKEEAVNELSCRSTTARGTKRKRSRKRRETAAATDT